MQPSLWGPHLWRAIHYIALGFPENPEPLVQTQYKDFYLNFWKFIPCLKCSLNYKRHLQEIAAIDDYLYSPRDLFMWTWMMHNIVNKELGKPEIEFDTAYAMYQPEVALSDSIHNTNNTNNTNNNVTTESFIDITKTATYPFNTGGELRNGDNNNNDISPNILYPPSPYYGNYDSAVYQQMQQHQKNEQDSRTSIFSIQNLVMVVLFITILALILFIYFKQLYVL